MASLGGLCRSQRNGASRGPFIPRCAGAIWTRPHGLDRRNRWAGMLAGSVLPRGPLDPPVCADCCRDRDECAAQACRRRERICHSDVVLILLFFLDFLSPPCLRAINDTFSRWDAFPASNGHGWMVAVAGSLLQRDFIWMAGSASLVGVRHVVVTGIRILCDVCLVALLPVDALFEGIRNSRDRSTIHAFPLHGYAIAESFCCSVLLFWRVLAHISNNTNSVRLLCLCN